MEKTEREIQKGLEKELEREGPEDEPLVRMVRYVGTYRGFYRAYLKAHTDTSLEAGLQAVWEQNLRPRFLAAGVRDERRMLYYYQFVRAGIAQILKMWIDGGCRETPEDIAGIIRAMLVSSYKKTGPSGVPERDSPG